MPALRVSPLVSFCVACGLFAVPLAAQAGPLELVEKRRNYLIFVDDDASLENANWFSRDPFLAGYGEIEEGFLGAHPDDSQFLVMYTTWQLSGGLAFYQALANDTHGIGFQRIAKTDPVIPAEIFDDTPRSQVQGLLHMSDFNQYLARDGVSLDEFAISLIFGQELGHAWLAFVHFDQSRGVEANMLGREGAHWSFYLHTGGSPAQGHAWVDNGDGTFTARQDEKYVFSDLDLYLMGLLPPEEVDPWFLIENPRGCIDSTTGKCATAETHLFTNDVYRVSGTRRDIRIEDVIRAEGPRMPAWPDTPDTFDLSFILVMRPDDKLTEGDKKNLERIIDHSLTTWEGQTRGLAHLVNRTDADPDPGGTGTGGDTRAGTGTSEGGSAGTSGDSDGVSGSSGTDREPPTASDSDTEEGAGVGRGGTDGQAGDEPAVSSGKGCGCRATPAAGWGSLAWLGFVGRRRRRIAATRRYAPLCAAQSYLATVHGSSKAIVVHRRTAS